MKLENRIANLDPKTPEVRTSLEDARLLEDLPDLLSVKDLGALTGLSPQTLRKEIVEGRLPGCRIGRRLYVPKIRLVDYMMSEGGLHA